MTKATFDTVVGMIAAIVSFQRALNAIEIKAFGWVVVWLIIAILSCLLFDNGYKNLPKK